MYKKEGTVMVNLSKKQLYIITWILLMKLTIINQHFILQIYII